MEIQAADIVKVGEKGAGGVGDGGLLWSEVLKKAGVASLDALNGDKVDDLAEWLTQFFSRNAAVGARRGQAKVVAVAVARAVIGRTAGYGCVRICCVGCEGRYILAS